LLLDRDVGSVLLDRGSRDVESGLKNADDLVDDGSLHRPDDELLRSRRRDDGFGWDGEGREGEDGRILVLSWSERSTLVDGREEFRRLSKQISNRLVPFADVGFESMNLVAGLVVLLEVPSRDLTFADPTENSDDGDGATVREGRDGLRWRASIESETESSRLRFLDVHLWSFLLGRESDDGFDDPHRVGSLSGEAISHEHPAPVHLEVNWSWFSVFLVVARIGEDLKKGEGRREVRVYSQARPGEIEKREEKTNLKTETSLDRVRIVLQQLSSRLSED